MTMKGNRLPIVTFVCILLLLLLFLNFSSLMRKTMEAVEHSKLTDHGEVRIMPVADARTLNELNGPSTEQDAPDLVDIVRRVFIQQPAPTSAPYHLKNPELKDFSKGQSAIIDKLFKRKRNGFFVECGALDGEGRSNSLFFERERGWQGLLVEADPSNYRELVQRNRKAHSINACLSVVPYPAKMQFNQAQNMGRVFKSEKERKWAKSHHLKINTISMQCFPLYTLMRAMNRSSIDFFSLDVEGSEMDVLKTIPFHNIDIKSITVEFVHGGDGGKKQLQEFIESKGYSKIGEVTEKTGAANDLLFAKNYLLQKD